VPLYTDLLGWPDEAEMLEAARDEEEFEAEAELFGKLERLKALMPGEELAVVEAAVAEKLERRARRHTKRVPRRGPAASGIVEEPPDPPPVADPGGAYPPASPGLPAARRLSEWERDEERCRFLDTHGRRCPELTGFFPSAYGGLCPVHHRHVPVRDHGRMKGLRHWRSRPRST
jgi:hypothetical protein